MGTEIEPSTSVRETYRDRHEAARTLIEALQQRRLRGNDLVVLGLPRGGVPVAHEVARALGAPLDVLVVKKLGVPGHEELAMGALASGGIRVMNPSVGPQVPEEVVEDVTRSEREALRRREEELRGGAPPVDVAGKTVILVDDGIATGSTMQAAVEATRERGAASVVVAVPVASPRSVERLRHVADDVVCPSTPAGFMAIGQYYDRFPQVSTEEAARLVRRSSAEEARS